MTSSCVGRYSERKADDFLGKLLTVTYFKSQVRGIVVLLINTSEMFVF